MDRRCDQCECSRPLADSILLECREGPKLYVIHPEHWCYRFRLAERLTDNKDMRET